MELKEIKKLKKNLQRFCCEPCDFKCYMKCDWDRHVLRPKHLKCTQGNDMEIKKLKKTYNCDCSKLYLSASGLWKHKKVCNQISSQEDKDIDDNKDTDDKELIMMLVKQNSELLEVIKGGTHNNNNSHNNTINTNSLNKTFNLQFFLNETCKDAMNIMDFVDSIKLELSDLENVGRIGYVEGISNIITKNLKALDITQRPIHCADKKREVVYVRDENKWEKEDEEKKTLRKLIKRVASKNFRLVPKFKEVHPDYGKASSKISDQYNKIIIESCGGSGDNDVEKEDKIIHKITNVTTIDKDC
jgi:hypothetical protein